MTVVGEPDKAKACTGPHQLPVMAFRRTCAPSNIHPFSRSTFCGGVEVRFG